MVRVNADVRSGPRRLHAHGTGYDHGIMTNSRNTTAAGNQPAALNPRSDAAPIGGAETVSSREHLKRVALTIRQIGAVLGLGRPLVLKLLASSELEVHTVGRRTFVLRRDLEAWLLASTEAAQQGGTR